MKTYEVGIIGGGIVGTSIAFGELLRGKSVIVLDGDKDDNKASFANFGLVWSQGKGANMPAYQTLTKTSTEMWPDFVKQLEEISGIVIQYEHSGGLVYCAGDEEYEVRQKLLIKLQKELGCERDWEMVGREETQKRCGSMTLGPKIVGASYSYRDGAVNPLLLSRALKIAIVKLGGKIMQQNPVQSLVEKLGSWKISTSTETIHVNSVVVAAGLGTKKIVEKLGVSLPITADKGQIIVSERLPISVLLPGSGMRQTQDGSFIIGATQEGNKDRRSTIAAGVKLTRRAVTVFPALENVKIVRQWVGHRIVSPDTYPIYLQPFDNLTIAVCHSGITIAAFHCSEWMSNPKIFQQFNPNRF